MGGEVPVGWCSLTPADEDIPPGFLPADGRRLRKTHYDKLWAVVAGVKHKVGPLERQSWWPWFRVPDFRRAAAEESAELGVEVVALIKAELVSER